MAFLTPAELRIMGGISDFSNFLDRSAPTFSLADQVEQKDTNLTVLRDTHLDWRLRLAASKKETSFPESARQKSKQTNVSGFGENPKELDSNNNALSRSRRYEISEIFLSWRAESCRSRLLAKKKLLKEKRTMLKSIRWARKRVIMSDKIRAWKANVDFSIVFHAFITKTAVKISVQLEAEILKSWAYQVSNRTLHRRLLTKFVALSNSRNLQKHGQALIDEWFRKQRRKKRCLYLMSQNCQFTSRKLFGLWMELVKKKRCIRRSVQAARRSKLKRLFQIFRIVIAQILRTKRLRLHFSFRERQHNLKIAFEEWANDKVNASSTRIAHKRASRRRIYYLMRRNFLGLDSNAGRSLRFKRIVLSVKYIAGQSTVHRYLSGWRDQVMKRKVHAKLSKIISVRRNRGNLTSFLRSLLLYMTVLRRRTRILRNRIKSIQRDRFHLWYGLLQGKHRLVRRGCAVSQHAHRRSSFHCFDALVAGLDVSRAAEEYVLTCIRIRTIKTYARTLASWITYLCNAQVTLSTALAKAASKCSSIKLQFLRRWTYFVSNVISVRVAEDRNRARRQRTLKSGSIEMLRTHSVQYRRLNRVECRIRKRSAERLRANVFRTWLETVRKTAHVKASCASLLQAKALARRKGALKCWSCNSRRLVVLRRRETVIRSRARSAVIAIALSSWIWECARRTVSQRAINQMRSRRRLTQLRDCVCGWRRLQYAARNLSKKVRAAAAHMVKRKVQISLAKLWTWSRAKRKTALMVRWSRAWRCREAARCMVGWWHFVKESQERTKWHCARYCSVATMGYRVHVHSLSFDVMRGWRRQSEVSRRLAANAKKIRRGGGFLILGRTFTQLGIYVRTRRRLQHLALQLSSGRRRAALSTAMAIWNSYLCVCRVHIRNVTKLVARREAYLMGLSLYEFARNAAVCRHAARLRQSGIMARLISLKRDAMARWILMVGVQRRLVRAKDRLLASTKKTATAAVLGAWAERYRGEIDLELKLERYEAQQQKRAALRCFGGWWGGIQHRRALKRLGISIELNRCSQSLGDAWRTIVIFSNKRRMHKAACVLLHKLHASLLWRTFGIGWMVRAFQKRLLTRLAHKAQMRQNERLAARHYDHWIAVSARQRRHKVLKSGFHCRMRQQRVTAAFLQLDRYVTARMRRRILDDRAERLRMASVSASMLGWCRKLQESVRSSRAERRKLEGAKRMSTKCSVHKIKEAWWVWKRATELGHEEAAQMSWATTHHKRKARDRNFCALRLNADEKRAWSSQLERARQNFRRISLAYSLGTWTKKVKSERQSVRGIMRLAGMHNKLLSGRFLRGWWCASSSKVVRGLLSVRGFNRHRRVTSLRAFVHWLEESKALRHRRYKLRKATMLPIRSSIRRVLAGWARAWRRTVFLSRISGLMINRRAAANAVAFQDALYVWHETALRRRRVEHEFKKRQQRIGNTLLLFSLSQWRALGRMHRRLAKVQQLLKIRFVHNTLKSHFRQWQLAAIWGAGLAKMQISEEKWNNCDRMQVVVSRWRLKSVKRRVNCSSIRWFASRRRNSILRREFKALKLFAERCRILHRSSIAVANMIARTRQRNSVLTWQSASSQAAVLLRHFFRVRNASVFRTLASIWGDWKSYAWERIVHSRNLQWSIRKAIRQKLVAVVGSWSIRTVQKHRNLIKLRFLLQHHGCARVKEYFIRWVSGLFWQRWFKRRSAKAAFHTCVRCARLAFACLTVYTALKRRLNALSAKAVAFWSASARKYVYMWRGAVQSRILASKQTQRAEAMAVKRIILNCRLHVDAWTTAATVQHQQREAICRFIYECRRQRKRRHIDAFCCYAAVKTYRNRQKEKAQLQLERWRKHHFVRFWADLAASAKVSSHTAAMVHHRSIRGLMCLALSQWAGKTKKAICIVEAKKKFHQNVFFRSGARLIAYLRLCVQRRLAAERLAAALVVVCSRRWLQTILLRWHHVKFAAWHRHVQAQRIQARTTIRRMLSCLDCWKSRVDSAWYLRTHENLVSRRQRHVLLSRCWSAIFLRFRAKRRVVLREEAAQGRVCTWIAARCIAALRANIIEMRRNGVTAHHLRHRRDLQAMLEIFNFMRQRAFLLLLRRRQGMCLERRHSYRLLTASLRNFQTSIFQNRRKEQMLNRFHKGAVIDAKLSVITEWQKTVRAKLKRNQKLTTMKRGNMHGQLRGLWQRFRLLVRNQAHQRRRVQTRQVSARFWLVRCLVYEWASEARSRHHVRLVQRRLFRQGAFHILQHAWTLLMRYYRNHLGYKHARKTASRRREFRIAKASLYCLREFAAAGLRRSSLEIKVRHRQGWGARFLMQLWWNAAALQVQISRTNRDALHESVRRADNVTRREGKLCIKRWAVRALESKRIRVVTESLAKERLQRTVKKSISFLHFYSQQNAKQRWRVYRLQRRRGWLLVLFKWLIWEEWVRKQIYLKTKAKKASKLYKQTALGHGIHAWSSWTRRWRKALKMLSCSSLVLSHQRRVDCLDSWHKIACLQRAARKRHSRGAWRREQGCVRRMLLGWSAASSSARLTTKSGMRLLTSRKMAEERRRFLCWIESTRAVLYRRNLLQRHLRNSSRRELMRFFIMMKAMVAMTRAARATGDQQASQNSVKALRKAWKSWICVLIRIGILEHAAAAVIVQRKQCALLSDSLAMWLSISCKQKEVLLMARNKFLDKEKRSKLTVFNGWHAIQVSLKQRRLCRKRAVARRLLNLLNKSMKNWLQLVTEKCCRRRVSSFILSRQKQQRQSRSYLLWTETFWMLRIGRVATQRAADFIRKSRLSKFLGSWRLTSYLKICALAKIHRMRQKQCRKLIVAAFFCLRRDSKLIRQTRATKNWKQNRFLQSFLFTMRNRCMQKRKKLLFICKHVERHRRSRKKMLFLAWSHVAVKQSAQKEVMIAARRRAGALSAGLTLQNASLFYRFWASTAAEMHLLHLAASRVVQRRIRLTARSTTRKLQHYAFRQISLRRVAARISKNSGCILCEQILRNWHRVCLEGRRLCSLEAYIGRRKKREWLQRLLNSWRGYISSNNCVSVAKGALVKLCGLRVGYPSRAALTLVIWRQSCLRTKKMVEKATISRYKRQKSMLKKWMFVTMRNSQILGLGRKLWQSQRRRRIHISLELWYRRIVCIPAAVLRRAHIRVERRLVTAWYVWLDMMREVSVVKVRVTSLISRHVSRTVDTFFLGWLALLTSQEWVSAVSVGRALRGVLNGRGPLTRSMRRWQSVCSAERRRFYFKQRVNLQSSRLLKCWALISFDDHVVCHKRLEKLMQKAQLLRRRVETKRFVNTWHRTAIEQANVRQNRRRAAAACTRFITRRLVQILLFWAVTSTVERQIRRKLQRPARRLHCMRQWFRSFSAVVAERKVRQHRAVKAVTAAIRRTMNAFLKQISGLVTKNRRLAHLESIIGSRSRWRLLATSWRGWVIEGAQFATSTHLAESWRGKIAQHAMLTGCSMALWRKCTMASRNKLQAWKLHLRRIISRAVLRWTNKTQIRLWLRQLTAVIENTLDRRILNVFLRVWAQSTESRQRIQLSIVQRSHSQLLRSAWMAQRTELARHRRIREIKSAVERKPLVLFLRVWMHTWIRTSKQGRKITGAVMQLMMRGLLKLLVGSFGQWTLYIQSARVSARNERVALQMCQRRGLLQVTIVLRELRRAATQAKLDSSGAWRELVGDEWRASLRRERCLRIWRIAAKKCRRIRICHARAEAAWRRRSVLNGLLVWVSWVAFQSGAKRKGARLALSKTIRQLRSALLAMGEYATWRRKLTRRIALAGARCSVRERETYQAAFVAWTGILTSIRHDSASGGEGSDLRAVMEAVADRLGRLREDLSCIPCDSDGTPEPDRMS